MKRWLAFAVVLAALFLAVNRPAYRSFFAEDDLDNLANARDIRAADIVRTLSSPRVTGGYEFRGTTYAFYYGMVRTAGLKYAPYVAAIHVIHLFNVLLIFLVVRALGGQTLSCCAAALFYTFHAAAFDIYWKPMYAFDLLCATFALAALLTYIQGRWILALLCFWLSLRAKEVTILFPLILAAYEILLGERRWKRLLPFFAVSAIAGLFALQGNHGPETPYTFHFTLTALRQTASYYSEHLAGVPWVGLVILAVPFFTKDRRIWFGIATFVLLLAPMLFLPGRLFAAYLYAPMIGLSVALGVGLQNFNPAIAAAFFLLWLPWNFHQFRALRTQALTEAYERRAWFEPVAEFFHQHPETDTVVWDGTPTSVPEHYISGAVRLLQRNKPARVTWFHHTTDETQQPNLVVLVWDEARRKLHVLGRQPDVSYLQLNETAPIWQLTSGWLGNQGHLRWSRPHATVRLLRPSDATTFEIAVNEYGFDADHPGRLDLTLNGTPLGSASLNVHEPRTFRFPLESAAAGLVDVGLTVTPPFHDPNGDGDLGQPITAMGFVAK